MSTLNKKSVNEGNNPYSSDNFWIVFSDSHGREYVLDGFRTEREAISKLPRWLKDYPNAKVTDYDPMFVESSFSIKLTKDYIIEGNVVKAGSDLDIINEAFNEITFDEAVNILQNNRALSVSITTIPINFIYTNKNIVVDSVLAEGNQIILRTPLLTVVLYKDIVKREVGFSERTNTLMLSYNGVVFNISLG